MFCHIQYTVYSPYLPIYYISTLIHLCKNTFQSSGLSSVYIYVYVKVLILGTRTFSQLGRSDVKRVKIWLLQLYLILQGRLKLQVTLRLLPLVWIPTTRVPTNVLWVLFTRFVTFFFFSYTQKSIPYFLPVMSSFPFIYCTDKTSQTQQPRSVSRTVCLRHIWCEFFTCLTLYGDNECLPYSRFFSERHKWISKSSFLRFVGVYF